MVSARLLQLLLLHAIAFCLPVHGETSGQAQRAVTCKHNEVAVQRASALPSSNGCGAGGITVSSETDFTPCCDLHDACYSFCGAAKASCDSSFGKCMKKMCAGQKDCENSADMYVMGTRMFGQSAFDSSQKSVCACISKAEERSHAEGLLRAFYARHNSSKLNEEGFLQRVLDDEYGQDGVGKGTFWKVLNRLYSKYPEGILKEPPHPSLQATKGAAAGGGRRQQEL